MFPPLFYRPWAFYQAYSGSGYLQMTFFIRLIHFISVSGFFLLLDTKGTTLEGVEKK